MRTCIYTSKYTLTLIVPFTMYLDPKQHLSQLNVCLLMIRWGGEQPPVMLGNITSQACIQWIPQYNWHNSDCVTITCSCEFGKPACESLWACGMLGITHGMNHLCTSQQCAIINPSLQEQGCPCLKPMGIWESRKQLIYLH